MKFYILTQDNDSHWYVIPKDRASDWRKFLILLDEYYASAKWEFEGDEPELPSWADRVGGSPSLVRFEEYVID